MENELEKINTTPKTLDEVVQVIGQLVKIIINQKNEMDSLRERFNNPLSNLKKPEAEPHIPCKTIPEFDKEIIIAANAKITLPFFNRLPTAILENYLLPDLHLTEDKKTTGLLGLISRTGTLFQEHQLNTQIDTLLQAVVYAQYDEVKEILDKAAKKSRPLLEKLLTTYGKAVDYSGRHVYGTALQLALGAGDVSRPKFPNEGMAELIMSYYEKLLNGKSLKQAHINEFAKHAEISPEQNAKDISVVEKVFQDITDAKTNNEEEKALKVFRKYLEPDPNELITGKHFNHNMLIRAYALYKRYYVQFGGWDSHKNNLVWRKVIGYLQRFIPACDGYAMAQGFWDVTENNAPLNRSLEFRYDHGIFVFPLPVGASGLGYEYAGDGSRCIAAPDPMPGWAWFLGWRGCFSKLMSIKNKQVTNYIEPKPHIIRPSTCTLM